VFVASRPLADVEIASARLRSVACADRQNCPNPAHGLAQWDAGLGRRRCEEVHVGSSEFVGRCQFGALPWAGESRTRLSTGAQVAHAIGTP
jgi:hypothetical protein